MPSRTGNASTRSAGRGSAIALATERGKNATGGSGPTREKQGDFSMKFLMSAPCFCRCSDRRRPALS